MPLAAGRGIPVHPGDPGVGKEGLELPLHLLGAHPELPQGEAAAVRTAIRGSPLMGAVVASQESRAAVQRQADATVGAAKEVAAIPAEE